jgi:2-phospho-L-lactate/phosphoenolpyruvate guanylyltransferase
MRVAAIVPVKRFGEAKRRLAEGLGDDARRELTLAMLGDVLDAIGRSAEIERVLVVTTQDQLPESDTAWVEVPDAPKRSTHSGAARRGIRRALRGGADCAVLLPGDCPLLDPAELDGALRRARPGRVGIVPDRHGSGTNALILYPPDAIKPAFGEGSRARHEELAREAGAEPAVERLYSLAIDVDTPEDLAVLRQILDRNPNLAPRTARALSALRRQPA